MGLIRDLECIVSKMELDRQEFEAGLKQAVSRFDFKTTVVSSQPNTRNRYLSILAFVYIPLSFITSAFGMNVEKWGTGNVQLWIPVTSAGALLSAMALLILLIPVSERLSERWRIHFDRLPRALYVTLKFATYSPINAFWLLCIICSHPQPIPNICLATLGLYATMDAGHGWSTSILREHDLDKIKPFFRPKLRRVHEFTQDPSWLDNPVWKRWGRKICELATLPTFKVNQPGSTD